MKIPLIIRSGHNRTTRLAQQGNGKIILFVALCFVAGAGIFWHFQSNKRHVENPEAPAEKQLPKLSDATKSVLGNLQSPVELRFYSSLDPASVPQSDRHFSSRVDDLLSAYERDGNGKISVIRHASGSDADAQAAAQDGIELFNRDKGDACYLGIVVISGGLKENFSRLVPEWEQALEPDLSRAIQRVSAAASPVVKNKIAPPPTAASAEDLKQALPDLDSLSLEQAKEKLRQSALEDFKKAAAEMDAEVKAAQQELAAAQNGKSETEQQAAMKNLQQVQAKSGEKLKEITARLQAQLSALEKEKSGSK